MRSRRTAARRVQSRMLETARARHQNSTFRNQPPEKLAASPPVYFKRALRHEGGAIGINWRRFEAKGKFSDETNGCLDGAACARRCMVDADSCSRHGCCQKQPAGRQENPAAAESAVRVPEETREGASEVATKSGQTAAKGGEEVRKRATQAAQERESAR